MWLFACTENELELICVKKNMINITESYTKEDAKTSAFIFHVKEKDVRGDCEEIALI